MLMFFWVLMFLQAGTFDQRWTSGNPFDRKELKSFHTEPRWFGKPSSGCLTGAVPLDLESEDYLVMNPQRNAFWGLPVLRKKVTQWSQDLRKRSGRACQIPKIGDLSLPFGGPVTPRHATHQLGNDVDILLETVQCGTKYRDLERPMATTDFAKLEVKREFDDTGGVVYRLDAKILSPWSRQTAQNIFAIAADPDVERVLVNPVIRRQLCKEAKVVERAQAAKKSGLSLTPESVPSDLRLFRRIRTVLGHKYHMHVRIHPCADRQDCKRELARPYANTDWGLGCNLDRGPLGWYFGDIELNFDPNADYVAPTSYLSHKMYQLECAKSPDAKPCTQRPQAKKLDSLKVRHGCYQIKVHGDPSGEFEVEKCVPQVCDDLIHQRYRSPSPVRVSL